MEKHNKSQSQTKIKKPAFSHDKFFKAFFSDPKFARELLELAFTKKELEVFDLKNLKIEKDSFEGGLRADLIISVRFKAHLKQRVNFLVLLEHKSHYDKGLFNKQLDYQILLRRQHIKQAGCAQPIIPLLFYHGKGLFKWKKTLQEEEFKAFFSKIPIGIRKVMLNFGMRVINTKDLKIRKLYENKGSKIWGILKLLDEIWGIRNPSAERLRLIIRDYFGDILKGKSDKSVKEIVCRVIEYLRDAASFKEEAWKKAERLLIEDGILKKGGAMDIKEHFKEVGHWEGRQEGERKGRQEGRQEGRLEGRQEGRQEVILNMLKKKADISFISEVTGLSEKEIKKLKNGA